MYMLIFGKLGNPEQKILKAKGCGEAGYMPALRASPHIFRPSKILICFLLSLGRVGLCAAMPRGNAYLIARGKSHDPPELGLGAGATPEDPWTPNGDRVCIPSWFVARFLALIDFLGWIQGWTREVRSSFGSRCFASRWRLGYPPSCQPTASLWSFCSNSHPPGFGQGG